MLLQDVWIFYIVDLRVPLKPTVGVIALARLKDILNRTFLWQNHAAQKSTLFFVKTAVRLCESEGGMTVVLNDF